VAQKHNIEFEQQLDGCDELLREADIGNIPTNIDSENSIAFFGTKHLLINR